MRRDSKKKQCLFEYNVVDVDEELSVHVTYLVSLSDFYIPITKIPK